MVVPYNYGISTTNITESIANNDWKNVWNTIFHPKVLGLLVMLLIASFTIRYMASST